METEYTYNHNKYGEYKFTVTEPEDCKMKVENDKYSIIISINVSRKSGQFELTFSGEPNVHAVENTAKNALNSACYYVVERLAPLTTEEELCSQMKDLYNEIKG